MTTPRNQRLYARLTQQESTPQPSHPDSLHEHQLSRSASNPITDGQGRLHRGVRGAHPSQGGIETPQADLDADDRRFGPEARFTMGPGGRDSMTAGQLEFGTKGEHVDHAPYLRRPKSQGQTMPLPLSDDSMKPTDPALHYVHLNHPHLMGEYEFEKSGSDTTGHTLTVYHRGTNPTSGVANIEHVGELRWNGSKPTVKDNTGAKAAPGEIEFVGVQPHTETADGIVKHAGKGIATAMWDYANAHAALHKAQAPVHSSDRSTAGNHWAHFVGGATLPRTRGHDVAEY